MSARDFDQEIAKLTSQIGTLDESATETMLLEQQLEQDLTRLEAELGTPTVALDAKSFKKVNDAIEAANVRLATLRRSMAAISKARMEVDEQRRGATSAKHQSIALESGRSAVLLAEEIDQDIVPELARTVHDLIAYINQTVQQANLAGGRNPKLDPRAEIACAFARVLREAGLDLVAGPSITQSRGNSEGHRSLTEALAEFSAAIEYPG